MVDVPVHKDVIGREIQIGDCVAVAWGSGLTICKVTKFTPKMVRVHPINSKRATKGHLKYGQEMVVVPGEDVFIHVLTS
jgi:hypothetical protein